MCSSTPGEHTYWQVGLSLEIFRALTTLRGLPVDILCGNLDIARLAMDTAVAQSELSQVIT